MAKKTENKKAKFAKSALATKERVITSTGGGEPIPKGEKWTDEKRDEDQPRTDDGKFGTYASVGKTTKYPEHAWRGTYEKGHPLNPEGKKLSEKEKMKIWNDDVKETPDIGKQIEQHYAEKISGTIKRGTKFAINGKIYIAAINMNVDDFKDALRHYWEDAKGNGHFGDVDKALIAKSGARSQAEKEALDRSNRDRDGMYQADRIEVVTSKSGAAEIASLRSDVMKDKVRKAASEYRKQKAAGYPKQDMSRAVQKRSLERQGAEAEQHYNPDSEHDDQYIMDALNKGDMSVLGANRYMDGGSFKLDDETAGKLGMSGQEMIDMLKSGELKLSDVKAILRGE